MVLFMAVHSFVTWENFPSVKQHIHCRINLFTHMNNLLKLIRHFLTLVFAHNSANLCEMRAGPSQSQCIIPATLAGSATSADIRSARGQPVCALFGDSTYGPAALTFILLYRSQGTELLWRVEVQSALLQGLYHLG